MRNNILLSIISLAFASSSAFSQNFEKNSVIADLDFLYKTLEETHYNLYAYTDKQEFTKNYLEIKKSIVQDSLSLLQATSLFQQVVSKANIGHTSIDFPIQPYIDYATSGGTLFPLEIAFEYDKALIRKNWSTNQNIEVGSEILSINGVSISKIVSEIRAYISAERTYFKNAKIELYSFPRYYWQAFGEVDEFEIKALVKGKVVSHFFKAINVIEDYETKRTEVLNAEMKLEFRGSIAYLNPGGFGEDQTKYKAFIDSSFLQINQNIIDNLIIDLRNNPGGDDALSDYMVSYIADKPFKWCSDFTLKTSKHLKDHIRQHNDTTDVYWQKALAHKDGEIYKYSFDEYQPQPEEVKFKGNVYVLINRQSHSQSAVAASQIQDNHFGTIVGEETGDYPSLHASIFQFSLPNTNVIVNTPKGYIVRVNGSKEESGVIPDIFIKDHLLDDKDEILDGLINIINKK